ncbi:hypothetical protein ABZ851_35820, partial [Streptomyces sp. NPDC047049]|uniref:hypothetical protein n=1 Tax=Streptomyces sp. NPDC047049 TaxID=3156688 RepID=UPI0033DF7519
SGVDFWHAVEFSRNGRFLWIPSRVSSGRFPSVFHTLSGLFRLSNRRFSADMQKRAILVAIKTLGVPPTSTGRS